MPTKNFPLVSKLSVRAYSEAVSRNHGMVEVGVRLPVGPLAKRVEYSRQISLPAWGVEGRSNVFCFKKLRGGPATEPNMGEVRVVGDSP